MRVWSSPWFELGCRYFLGAVLLMAAVTKLTDLGAFANRVHAGLPSWLAVVVVAVLPWLELTCGLCLALGLAIRESAALLAALLVLLLVYTLTHRDDSDCRCFFFPTPRLIEGGWWPSIRNLLLLVCALRVAWQKDTSPGKPAA